jgi:hypothetical protein
MRRRNPTVLIKEVPTQLQQQLDLLTTNLVAIPPY